jgi:hypothetical protein
MTNIINTKGEPCTQVNVINGFYKEGDHFYRFHEKGITHVHVNIINHLEVLYKSESERLEPISKEIFENEVRNAILEIGIYQYVK